MIYLANEFQGTLTELLSPWIPLIGTMAGGMIVGGFAIWNRRRGAVETRAPDVNEIWQQQQYQSKELEKEIHLRRRLEIFVDDLMRAFHDYVRRVQGGGSMDMTPYETRLHDSTPPTLDDHLSIK